MKRYCTALAAAVLALASPAAVPLRWTVETSRVQPAVFDVVRGETVELIATMQSYGKPFDVSGKDVSLYYQTNGMANAWWTGSASASSNVLSASFSPQMDPGASVINGYLGAPGDNYRASFVLRLRNGPGYAPNAVDLDIVQSIDFSRIVVYNAPWTNATTVASYTDEDAWIVATNAIDTVAGASITTAINTAMEDAFGTDWKTALGYGAGGFAGMIAAIFAALTMLKTGKLNKEDVVSPDGDDGFNNGKAADQGWVENYKTDCALMTTEIVDYYELKDSEGNYIRAHEGSGGIWSATYKTHNDAAVSTVCNGDYPVAIYYGAGGTASGALVVTFDKTNGWVQRSPYFNALMAGAVVDLDHNVISKTVTSLDKTTAKKAASLTDTALDFDATKTYAVGAFVKHGTDYYRCKTAITTAVAWDANKWERILTTGDVGGLVKLTPVFTNWSVSATRDLVGKTITFEWTRRSQGDGYVECWGYRISAGSLNYTDYTDKNATALEVITASGTISASRTIDHYTIGSGTEELLAGTKSSLFSSDGFKNATKDTIVQGDGVTITQNADKTITISATGGGGGSSKPSIKTFEQLKAYIDAKVADTSFTDDAARIAKMKSDLIGIEIPDTWANTGGTTYNDPMIIVNVGKWKGEDNAMHIGAMVMRKYTSAESVVFDMANQEVASETAAQEGVYYYGLALGETSVTAAKLTLLELNVGDSLPKSDYKTIYKNSVRDTSRNILQYGHNNWRDSAYRQWLNSFVAKGTSWWTQKHVGQIIPSNAKTVRGYMQGCSGWNGVNTDGTAKAYNNGLLKFAKPVYITTSPNYVSDGGNSADPSVGAYETLDLFFLPSGSEMFGSVNMTGTGDAMVSYEGDFSPYWKEATGFSAPNSTYSAARSIFAENGQSTAYNVRLRSAHRGYSYSVWYVYTSGNLNSYYANLAYAASPACVIY